MSAASTSRWVWKSSFLSLAAIVLAGSFSNISNSNYGGPVYGQTIDVRATVSQVNLPCTSIKVNDDIKLEMTLDVQSLKGSLISGESGSDSTGLEAVLENLVYTNIFQSMVGLCLPLFAMSGGATEDIS